MKNLNYFPFERNKYFYGKLLSVDDFNTEQKYMNDKRRMQNRFLHGAGVVCGLNVVQVDERTVSLEPGIALDFSGREMVLDRPVVKKLADIQGFDSYTEEDESDSHLYLCMEYAEFEKEPAYQVTVDKSGVQGTEFNKISEGCRIYLTKERPRQDCQGIDAYYEEAETVYWEKGVRISQIFPRYVESGQEFEWKLVVENMNQLPVKFYYQLGLECLENEGMDFISVAFDEEDYKKAGRYELSFHARAAGVKGLEGKAKVLKDNMSLYLGGRKVSGVEFRGTSQVFISEQSVLQELEEHYYREAMETVTKEGGELPVYLAEIAVIRGESTYMIDWIRRVPFRQYVYNHVLSALAKRSLEEEIKRLSGRLGRLETLRKNLGVKDGGEGLRGPRTASGTAVIDMGIGGTAGQRFFSQEIAHGLGLGTVHILLGEAYTLRDESSIVFGDGDIFQDKERSVKGSLAARLDVTKGTFVIGLKLSETTATRRVQIHWMAFKDGTDYGYEKSQRGIYMKPEMVYLKLRENYRFEPVLKGMADTEIIWSVKEEDGGSIDKNGVYTAPNLPGVYEIVAESAAYPGVKAVAFAVVRDI